MARKQPRLPGMENDGVSSDLEEAGQEHIGFKRDKRRLGEKVKESRVKVLVLMKRDGVKLFVAKDEDTGETVEFEVENEVKLKMRRKTDEKTNDVEPGESIAATPAAAGPHAGLIAEAERSMDGTNAVVDGEGDVVPKDESAPKKKRGKRKAKK